MKLLFSDLTFGMKWKVILSKPDYMASLKSNESEWQRRRELPPKGKYKPLSPLQSIMIVILFILLVALSLVLIKTSVNLELPFLITFYFALLGGYGLVGNYLDQETEFGKV